jgi:hypothetical protein
MEEPPLGESSRSYGSRIMTSVKRLVVTLKLRKGTQEQATKLIAAGPPFDPGDLGLARHAVYLGADIAIFAFEGEDVEERVRAVINDPVRSASFAAWVPLLAGRPALAHEVYYWEADDARTARPPSRRG